MKFMQNILILLTKKTTQKNTVRDLVCRSVALFSDITGERVSAMLFHAPLRDPRKRKKEPPAARLVPAAASESRFTTLQSERTTVSRFSVFLPPSRTSPGTEGENAEYKRYSLVCARLGGSAPVICAAIPPSGVR